MAKKVRNYPAFSLAEAIDFAKKIFDKENRNKIPRELVAARLGYSGLHGIALRKIGALKAYGLLEGSGDEQQISSLAVSILAAPKDSAERAKALREAALKPPLFAEIDEHFDSRPTLENTRYFLQKQGFSTKAATTAAQAYLDTIGLSDVADTGYNNVEDENDMTATDLEVGDDIGRGLNDSLAIELRDAKTGRVEQRRSTETLNCRLPEGSHAAVTFSGPVTQKSIEKLVQFLRLVQDTYPSEDSE